jgi:hypothetical protein
MSVVRSSDSVAASMGFARLRKSHPLAHYCADIQRQSKNGEMNGICPATVLLSLARLCAMLHALL